MESEYKIFYHNYYLPTTIIKIYIYYMILQHINTYLVSISVEGVRV
jgi:hypothetical protein